MGKSANTRGRKKHEKELRRRKRLADRARASAARAPEATATETAEAPTAAPAARRPAGGQRTADLGPVAALLDIEAFSSAILDGEQTSRILSVLYALIERDELLVELRFKPAALREAEVKARLGELDGEEDAGKRQDEALRRVVPLLADEGFRRRAHEAFKKAGGARVVSVSPDRKREGEALALGALLAQGRPGEPIADNPLWRMIAVISFQEAGALFQYARNLRGPDGQGPAAEGAPEGGEGEAPTTPSEPAADGPGMEQDPAALQRAIGRVYHDRFRGAGEAVQRGEVDFLPLYHLLHLCRAYGRGLRRAKTATALGVSQDRFSSWLNERIGECAVKDLEPELLGRMAESILIEARAAAAEGATAQSERLLDVHGFLETPGEGEELGRNPLVRLIYFESLTELIDRARAAKEAGDLDQAENPDLVHVEAIVSEPTADAPLTAYGAALRERGEAEAAAKVEAFLAAAAD